MTLFYDVQIILNTRQEMRGSSRVVLERMKKQEETKENRRRREWEASQRSFGNFLYLSRARPGIFDTLLLWSPVGEFPFFLSSPLSLWVCSAIAYATEGGRIFNGLCLVTSYNKREQPLSRFYQFWDVGREKSVPTECAWHMVGI